MIITDSDPRLHQPGRHSLGNNLYLRVRSAANRQFYYRYRRAGRLHDKTLGSANKLSIEQARALATSFPQQLDEEAAHSAAPIHGAPRRATIRRLAAQLAETQRAMDVAVTELDRLSQQFAAIFEPPLYAARQLPSVPPTNNTEFAGDQSA